MQSRLLEMLKWFHQFCKENGLTYYAIGGTMLGTIRHQGFIPWDDDVDVGMPRPDYERFIRMTQGKVYDHYCTESFLDSQKEFTYLYAKVFDLNTTLIENRRKEVKRGIFLDVYPLDGAGNSEEEGQKFFRPIGNRANWITVRVSAVRKGRSFAKNMAVVAARMIPEFIDDPLKDIRSLDEYCRSKGYENSNIVGNLYGLKRSRELMPKEYFGTPKEYPFEDTVIMGVEKPDEYLTVLFHDWRKLPPESEQVTHHDFSYCNLEQGYRKYEPQF